MSDLPVAIMIAVGSLAVAVGTVLVLVNYGLIAFGAVIFVLAVAAAWVGLQS